MIRLARRGEVSMAELEARFAAYMSAGAPEPVLEGTPAQQREMLLALAARGDAQMKALVERYLTALSR